MSSSRRFKCVHTIYHFYNKKKSPQIILNLQLWDFFLRTQEQVRNSRGQRAISVRATEVLLNTLWPNSANRRRKFKEIMSLIIP